MSSLSIATKNVLLKHVKPGRLLELFPGENMDSIHFLHSLTGFKITAIGKDSLSAFNLKYYQRKVPPYPRFFSKFNYIFLNQAEWLVYAEYGGPVDFSKLPDKTLTFISRNIKHGGKFIISSVHPEVAKLIFKWLSHYGKYSFEHESSVAIYTKL